MQVAKHINEDKPDFVVSLGDPFDLHGLGFTPALTKEQAAGAHAHARTFFSKLNESGAMYQVHATTHTHTHTHFSLAHLLTYSILVRYLAIGKVNLGVTPLKKR